MKEYRTEPPKLHSKLPKVTIERLQATKKMMDRYAYYTILSNIGNDMVKNWEILRSLDGEYNKKAADLIMRLNIGMLKFLGDALIKDPFKPEYINEDGEK